MRAPFNLFSVLTSRIFLGTTIAFAIGFAIQTGRIELGFKPELRTIRIDLEAARQRTAAEIATHKATKEAYQRAQADAALAEAQRLARVVAEQKEITDAVRTEYAARLANLRSLYERLRREAGRAGTDPAGAAGDLSVPAVSDPASGTDAPSCDGVPADDLALRYCAAAQQAQLDELITWVETQLRVEVDGGR